MATTATSHARHTTAEVPPQEVLLRHQVAPARVHELVEGERCLEPLFQDAPVLVAGAMTLALTIVPWLLGFPADDLAASATGSREFANLTSTLLGAAALAVVLTWLGWWRRVGFAGPSQWRDLRLLAFPTVLILVICVSGLYGTELESPSRLVVAIPAPFFTGFLEEGLWRGFLLYLLLIAAMRRSKGPLRAVLVSGAAFGLSHVLIGLGGGSPMQTLSTIANATLFGIGFAALALRTNALWLLAALHGLYNLAASIAYSRSDDVPVIIGLLAGRGGLASAVILSLPLAAYGLYLLQGGWASARPPGA